jgi:ribose 5-phosphate isomerase B
MCSDNQGGSGENSKKPVIAIGSDHAGFAIKNILKNILEKEFNYEVKDCGVYSDTPSDYPDIAKVVGKQISNGEIEKGILICATGIGMSIAANRFKGVRASVCHNKLSAIYSRKHNDANVLCLGSRINTIEEIKEILQIWLTTEFNGNSQNTEELRHLRRIKKIDEIQH